MANDDLKTIKDSLDKAIKLIRDEIALVSILHPRIDVIGARQEITNDKLDRVEEKVDALSGDIEQLHMDVKGIRDKKDCIIRGTREKLMRLKSTWIDPLFQISLELKKNKGGGQIVDPERSRRTYFVPKSKDFKSLYGFLII